MAPHLAAIPVTGLVRGLAVAVVAGLVSGLAGQAAAEELLGHRVLDDGTECSVSLAQPAGETGMVEINIRFVTADGKRVHQPAQIPAGEFRRMAAEPEKIGASLIRPACLRLGDAIKAGLTADAPKDGEAKDSPAKDDQAVDDHAVDMAPDDGESGGS